MPSLDHWIRLPFKGSRPSILRRRWTPAASTAASLPPDRWAPTQPNESSAPVLERRWTRGPALPLEAGHIPAGAGRETVTVGASTAGPAGSVTSGSETATPIAQPAIDGAVCSEPQTVTRLCVGCGQPLEGKRPQAKAHGVACRQRAYRRRKKEAAQAAARRGGDGRSEPRPAAAARTAVG